MIGYDDDHYDNTIYNQLLPSKISSIKNHTRRRPRRHMVYYNNVAIYCFMLSIVGFKHVWSKPYNIIDKLDSNKNSFVCRIVISPSEYDIYSMNVFGKTKTNDIGLNAILQTYDDDNNNNNKQSSYYYCQPYDNYILSDLMYQINNEIIHLSITTVNNIVSNDIIQYNGVKLNDTIATLILDDIKIFSVEILLKSTSTALTTTTNDNLETEEIIEYDDTDSKKKKKQINESSTNNEDANNKNDLLFQQENEPVKEYIVSLSNLTNENDNNDNNNDNNNINLSKKKTMGILKALIVRIIGMDHNEPKLSKEELIQYTFHDTISLKNQMYQCSAGQLIILPAIYDNGNENSTNNGIIDIQLTNRSIEGIDRNVLVNEALDLLPNILQQFDSSYGFKQESETNTNNNNTNDIISSIADLIMVIVPKGSLPITWAAYGVVDGRLTVFNDEWGSYVSATMHEIGHNLGLYHSKTLSDPIDEYGGQTGYMGAAMKSYSYPQKCYNSQNHWHLGWFKDKALDINEETLVNGPILFNIAAFVDYKMIQDNMEDNTLYVLLRINDIYYLQYNRAKKHNVGSTQYSDKLVIVEQNITTGGTTELVGLDDKDSSYNISFNKNASSLFGSKILVIDVCHVVNGTSISNETIIYADYMVVSIGYNVSICDSFRHDTIKSSPSPTISRTTTTASPSTTQTVSPTASPSMKPMADLMTLTPFNERGMNVSWSTLSPKIIQQNDSTIVISNNTNNKLENFTSNGIEGNPVPIEQNSSMFLLFILFQVSFLISLIFIYFLLVQHYKRQKAFHLKLQDDERDRRRIIDLVRNGGDDKFSIMNEPGDDNSLTDTETISNRFSMLNVKYYNLPS